MYALGTSAISYSCNFGAPPNYSFMAFDCTAFLERLAGLPGNGRNVNCSDCATIVSSFANALGAISGSRRCSMHSSLSRSTRPS